MTSIEIDSKFQLGGKLNDFTQKEIKNEPMFFNCDLDFAWKHGGPITRNFLTKLSENKIPSNTVFDSRSHMLMKGWFPAIPGYHHDDVPRNTVNGQPNYIDPEYKANHAMALINGGICPTEFAIGKIELEIPENEIIYKKWHQDIEACLNDDSMQSEFAESNRIIYFDWQTFHQATRAIADGWRWFGRASWNTDRSKKITNEIRNQVQVYLEHPMEGW